MQPVREHQAAGEDVGDAVHAALEGVLVVEAVARQVSAPGRPPG